MLSGRISRPAHTTLALCAAAVTAVVTTPPAQAGVNRGQKEVGQKPRAALSAHQKHLLHVLHVQHVQNQQVKSMASRKARIAVAYAKSRLGYPYRWGGSGPRSFDCSGLTLAAWRQAGVNLPHRARLQYRKGRYVSRSALRPGDLVFFYSSKSHVGIYIGNGRMVHAANRREDVKIDRITGGHYKRVYVGARRIA